MNEENPDPLDSLANQAEQLTAAPPTGEEPNQEEQAAADQAAQQEAQAMQMLEAGTVKVIHYLLKWTRSRISKELPEIHDEWTDDVLLRPSEASIPLIRKYMQTLLVIVGSSPELAVFAMSLMPMIFGILAAQDRHEAAQLEAKRRAAGLAATPADNVTDIRPGASTETPVNA